MKTMMIEYNEQDKTITQLLGGLIASGLIQCKEASSLTAEDQIHLTDLRGLGKELWHKHDPDAYIAKERASWD